MFLVDETTAAAQSLIQKLSEQSKPGAIIPLTSEEMDVYQSSDFEVLSIGEENSNIIEIDPEKSYVFMCDPANTVIQDVINITHRLGAKIAIVRTGG